MENSLAYADFASHELSLPEVRQMARGERNWGFFNGMFIAGNDDMIALRFKNGHSYEAVTRELWKRLCKDAPFVVDVGTHSGVFSLDAFKAGAKHVLSIEPHPINYSRLVINLRYNGFTPRGAYYGAAGDISAVQNFFISPSAMHMVHAAGQVDKAREGQIFFPVMVRRLDELIQPDSWHMLKALKIDAENKTPAVLRGMKGIFDAGHRPDLIIECTEDGMGEFLPPEYKFWRIWESGEIEQVDSLTPHNPNNNYNGTMEECRNRFASVRGLP